MFKSTSLSKNSFFLFAVRWIMRKILRHEVNFWTKRNAFRGKVKFKKTVFAHIYHDSKEPGMSVGNEVVL